MGLFDRFKAGLQKTQSKLVHEIKRIVTLSPKLTAAKLAFWLHEQKQSAMLAACDTFRAAAIDQLKLWGEHLKIPVVASAYGADPASVAHDAITASVSRKINYLIVDTAGRLHTKH